MGEWVVKLNEKGSIFDQGSEQRYGVYLGNFRDNSYACEYEAKKRCTILNTVLHDKIKEEDLIISVIWHGDKSKGGWSTEPDKGVLMYHKVLGKQVQSLNEGSLHKNKEACMIKLKAELKSEYSSFM